MVLAESPSVSAFAGAWAAGKQSVVQLGYAQHPARLDVIQLAVLETPHHGNHPLHDIAFRCQLSLGF
jgi:hypothetical protein